MNGEKIMRQLNPVLKSWFDAQALNPPAPAFCEPKKPIQMFLMTALCCVGLSEEGGDNKGAMIELFQDTIGRPQGEPWCLSFIQSCIAYIETFGFESGIKDTEHCLTAWLYSKVEKVSIPKAGDIVIYQMGDTSSGHAEIVISVSQDSIKTIGGNTSPTTTSLDLERNGDTIAIKERPMLGYPPKMRVLGFLRPF